MAPQYMYCSARPLPCRATQYSAAVRGQSNTAQEPGSALTNGRAAFHLKGEGRELLLSARTWSSIYLVKAFRDTDASSHLVIPAIQHIVKRLCRPRLLALVHYGRCKDTNIVVSRQSERRRPGWNIDRVRKEIRVRVSLVARGIIMTMGNKPSDVSTLDEARTQAHHFSVLIHAVPLTAARSRSTATLR